MRYRRADVTEGSCFFTVNLVERDKTLLVDYVDELRDAIKQVKQRHPFKIDGHVGECWGSYLTPTYGLCHWSL